MYKCRMLSVIQIAYAAIASPKGVCPGKSEKKYRRIGGSFSCSKCPNLLNHQSNVVIHLKICK